jgi:hypothetical protein
MNVFGLVAIILANLCLCVGAGVVVGIWIGDADLAVAVASGMAGLVSCVGAVLFLVCG